MTDRELVRGAVSRLDPRHLLPVGAALGLALAAAGAFSSRAAPPGADVAALVNGVPIARADRERVVEALAAGKRNPLDTEDKDQALMRLVEEELLIQRGIELGLHRSDPMVRKRLVSAMLEWITADATGKEPKEAELRAFLDRNRAFFTPAARLDLAWFHIARSTPDGEARAREAAKRLAAGDPFAEVAAMASPSALNVPPGLLPPAKLQDYLGPSLTREALTLKPGTSAGPFARTDGWHFLLVRRREDAATPAFGAIRDQVKAEYLRRRDDDAVRAYLDWLRRRADIVIAGKSGR